MAKLMNRKQAVGCSLLVAPHDCAACRICASQQAESKRSENDMQCISDVYHFASGQR